MVTERSGSHMIKAKALVQWLHAQGVPQGVDIPAQWQPQTGSIVGRWPE